MPKRPFLALLLLGGAGFPAQSRGIDASAQNSIQAGNLAWVNGMKGGHPSVIAATYTDDALDCGPDGNCRRGKAAILDDLKQRLERLGRANFAKVTSDGSVQQGNFVYEWGWAVASFNQGIKVQGRYLTVWQRQRDGAWKILRNLSIPGSSTSPRRERDGYGIKPGSSGLLPVRSGG
jgi:ketosteroid isomerase-like protein